MTGGSVGAAAGLPSSPSPTRVPWSGRGSIYTEDEIATVVDAMRTADPQTQGRCQQEFERAFAAHTGAAHAFAVTSCTAALELAALLCGLNSGDEVILPAHTFAASAIPFARAGARLVWADIDPDTRLVTAETIRPRLTARTRAIVVVHLYGLVCDMEPIMALARERGLLVVEDAAQALGAHYQGRAAGTIGDFGCYSFHTHKNITTLGEGGMLTVASLQHARSVPGLRHNGMRPYAENRERYWLPAMSDVDFDIEGLWPYNFCLGEVQCALGAQMLQRLDAINAQRTERARRFMSRLAGYPELSFQKVPAGCGHSWHLLAARYDGERWRRTRDEFLSDLAFVAGVRAVVQYCPLYRYPLFRRAGFGVADCPQSDRFFDNMVSFPFQQWMSDEQFELMTTLVTASLERMRAK
jgi:dTDP-4-amino-4,6-dideoxygalactose transaminase